MIFDFESYFLYILNFSRTYECGGKSGGLEVYAPLRDQDTLYIV